MISEGMVRQVRMRVNGHPVVAEVESRMLLVHFLREVARLRGTRVGCDTTSCGACTVLLDGWGVKSCTIFAAQADGREVTTIEGLADAQDGLHPLQEAFWQEHGLQCGYCTPGIIMAACQLLARRARPDERQIREAISGNLCRCTGYTNIVRAIQVAADRMA